MPPGSNALPSWLLADVSAPAHTRDMGEPSPMSVPGEDERAAPEVLEGLRATGLYGDLPPGMGPLLEVSASLIARAFAAFAADDWDMCDALIFEGLEAAGDVFSALAEHVTSPAWPYRVDSPAWPEFVFHLAFMAEPLPPDPPPPPRPVPPPAAAAPVSLADEMRAMGLM
jgi:hypothetical protein